MRYQLDELLAQISNSLILMSSACEESLTNAFDAFKAHDKEKALSIYNKDYDIHAKAREIEALCVKAMMRQQPVAKDMLIISATLKLASDVERIGTQAIAIAEIITNFDFSHQGDDILLVEKMSNEATTMVKNPLVPTIKKSNDDAESSLDLLMIAKYLERIGDHACNVAKCTQYVLTGKLKDQE